MDTSNLKKCPHCAEMIQADAKVCRYCGRNVDPNMILADGLKKAGGNMQLIGCLMTIFITIPICICLAVYFFGGG